MAFYIKNRTNEAGIPMPGNNNGTNAAGLKIPSTSATKTMTGMGLPKTKGGYPGVKR